MANMANMANMASMANMANMATHSHKVTSIVTRVHRGTSLRVL